MKKEAEPTVPCNPNNCMGCLTEKYNPVTVHGLSSEVKISQDIHPHNTNRILQPYSHTIQSGYFNHTPTQYNQDTSTIQPHNTIRILQPYSHTIQSEYFNHTATQYNRVPQPYIHTI